MTRYVIDVGCAPYGTADSVKALVDHFKPKCLVGYDPALAKSRTFMLNGTEVNLYRHAAWTKDGSVGFLDNGSMSKVLDEPETRVVSSRDLASVILTFPEPVVLKMDCEGGEYDLIPHLIQTGSYENVGRWLVEWHGDPLPGLPFECEPWWM